MAIPYEFETLPPDNYKLVFKMEATSNLFRRILGMTVNKIGYKGDVSDIESGMETTTAHGRYNAVIHSSIKKQIRQVNKQVTQDGILLRTSQVNQVTFTKDRDRWLINIEVGGVYVRK